MPQRQFFRLRSHDEPPCPSGIMEWASLRPGFRSCSRNIFPVQQTRSRRGRVEVLMENGMDKYIHRVILKLLTEEEAKSVSPSRKS